MCALISDPMRDFPGVAQLDVTRPSHLVERNG